MFLHTSSSSLFTVVAFPESPESEPQTIGCWMSFDEACLSAREFAESTLGIESAVVHGMQPDGSLGPSEACFLG
jgi:hypothetical protein